MGRPGVDRYVVQTKCPARSTYDAAVGRKVAQELADLVARDPAAATPGVVRDYSLLRRKCEAYEAQ